jgi:hypothetical protein
MKKKENKEINDNIETHKDTIMVKISLWGNIVTGIIVALVLVLVNALNEFIKTYIYPNIGIWIYTIDSLILLAFFKIFWNEFYKDYLENFKPVSLKDKNDEKNKRKDSKKRIDIEKVRFGYQMITNLWFYEGNLLWSKFNALLVANSILLASLGLLIKFESTFSKSLSIWIPLAGIILCTLWFFLTKRGFEYYDYWISNARKIEEDYPNDFLPIVSRGHDFVEGKDKEMRMGFLARFIKARKNSYVIIFLFFITHLIIFFIINQPIK